MTDAFDVVCDLGGTNVRFAAVTEGRIGGIVNHPLVAFDGFTSALKSYLDETRDGARPRALALGAAGPVGDGVVSLTNAPWTVVANDVAKLTTTGRVAIVNDLEAVARAIPALKRDEIAVLRDGKRSCDAVKLAVNVGTGFGAASIRPLTTNTAGTRRQWITAATEAGHMSFTGRPLPNAPDFQVETLEEVLSGRGLAACANAGRDPSGVPVFDDGAAVFARHTEPAAGAAIAGFGFALGRAVRDLILAHGAWGGVYLVGSVIDGWMPLDAQDAFLTGFQTHSPMAERLGAIPIYHITRAEPALAGLCELLSDMCGTDPL